RLFAYAGERFCRRVATGIDSSMDTFATAGRKHGTEELRLHKRLTARECNAAARFFEDNSVSQDLSQKLRDGRAIADALACFRYTLLTALSAKLASLGFAHGFPLVPVKCGVRARSDTFSTTDAALRGKHHFGRWHLAFGVVAPEAAKRTPLEEDSGANARPVIHGKPHEVEQSTDGICRCRKLVRRVHDVQSRRECIISGTSPLAGARYRMVVSSDLCLIQCY